MLVLENVGKPKKKVRIPSDPTKSEITVIIVAWCFLVGRCVCFLATVSTFLQENALVGKYVGMSPTGHMFLYELSILQFIDSRDIVQESETPGCHVLPLTLAFKIFLLLKFFHVSLQICSDLFQSKLSLCYHLEVAVQLWSGVSSSLCFVCLIYKLRIIIGPTTQNLCKD